MLGDDLDIGAHPRSQEMGAPIGHEDAHIEGDDVGDGDAQRRDALDLASKDDVGVSVDADARLLPAAHGADLGLVELHADEEAREIGERQEGRAAAHVRDARGDDGAAVDTDTEDRSVNGGADDRLFAPAPGLVDGEPGAAEVGHGGAQVRVPLLHGAGRDVRGRARRLQVLAADKARVVRGTPTSKLVERVLAIGARRGEAGASLGDSSLRRDRGGLRALHVAILVDGIETHEEIAGLYRVSRVHPELDDLAGCPRLDLDREIGLDVARGLGRHLEIAALHAHRLHFGRFRCLRGGPVVVAASDREDGEDDE